MAVDMFLKIEGVKGESQDAKHPDEIQIESFSFGVSNIGSVGQGGGLGSGKANFQDFSFHKRADLASPMLMQKCAQGEHIKTAVLTARKAGKNPQDYYKITFSDILISGFDNTGSGHDATPMEHCTLQFTKIEFEYKPQKADGSLGSVSKGVYNLSTNKGG